MNGHHNYIGVRLINFSIFSCIGGLASSTSNAPLFPVLRGGGAGRDLIHAAALGDERLPFLLAL